MKCPEIARLQDFAPNTQGLLGALSGPQTSCRIERTPLWKFLPTGLPCPMVNIYMYCHCYIYLPYRIVPNALITWTRNGTCVCILIHWYNQLSILHVLYVHCMFLKDLKLVFNPLTNLIYVYDIHSNQHVCFTYRASLLNWT